MRNLGFPVGPGLDFSPEIVAGAFGGTDLAMSVQDVAGFQLSAADSHGQQSLGSTDLSSSRFAIYNTNTPDTQLPNKFNKRFK